MEHQTIGACLSSLDCGWLLRATEAVCWLVGCSGLLTVEEAQERVVQAGIQGYPARVVLGEKRRADGVYGIGPDGSGWLLFRLEW